MKAESAYARAGVNIDRGNQAKALIKQLVGRTTTPAVLAGVGGFGAMYEFSGYRRPVLVSSTDSVGTKLMVARQAGRFDTVGVDIVNHCVNDILTCGAKPLFFLDYIAADTVLPEQIAEIVRGLAAACEAAGCALIGGETAELPGIYGPGEFDLAGFIVGAVEKDEIIDGHEIQVGDVLLGLPSSGLHTNGYSLVRKLFAGVPLTEYVPELGRTLGEELLIPHRSYLSDVSDLRQRLHIKGLAHITGGGLLENLPRILPEGLAAAIDVGSWQAPAIFRLLERKVAFQECYRVFNMGVGMVVVVSAEDAEQSALPVIGRIELGRGVTLHQPAERPRR